MLRMLTCKKGGPRLWIGLMQINGMRNKRIALIRILHGDMEEEKTNFAFPRKLCEITQFVKTNERLFPPMRVYVLPGQFSDCRGVALDVFRLFMLEIENRFHVLVVKSGLAHE